MFWPRPQDHISTLIDYVGRHTHQAPTGTNYTGDFDSGHCPVCMDNANTKFESESEKGAGCCWHVIFRLHTDRDVNYADSNSIQITKMGRASGQTLGCNCLLCSQSIERHIIDNPFMLPSPALQEWSTRNRQYDSENDGVWIESRCIQLYGLSCFDVFDGFHPDQPGLCGCISGLC